MNIIIDLDQHMAIESFASRIQLATPIPVKSQDTPSLHIYFVRAGVTYNLGASIGLKFGLYVTGNPNPLVQELTFTLMQDPQARSVYIGYPPFNTTAMQAAIGSLASINCTAELRYQLSSGQVIHVLDIPFTIQRTLMSENAIDATTASFTTPAVNANVTIAIGNTGWLSVNMLVNINGAGQYKVISITDATHFVAQNTGITGNAAPATVIPSGAVVGIYGTSVVETYPDPSVLELITHKNQPNGYAGLNASGALASSMIPVDNSSISLTAGGAIRIGYVIDTVQTAFTTPAANATVNVNVSASASFKVNEWIFIPIAGYYQVTALVDGTHITINNLGDTFNAIAGTTIAVGAVLLPQTALGSGGTAGGNAYSNTTASFIAPAVNATVSVSLGSTAWLGGAGYVVYINGAGYYAVSSITSTTVAVLTNLGYAGNVTAGTTVSIGALVTPGGLIGPGTTGASGSNAYDTTTASFVMPAAAASVNVVINNTAWLGIGQVVYIVGAGYLSVAAIVSGTTFSATNLNYIGNAGSGGTIVSGARVSPGGLVGAQGAGGPGLNAFTTLSANFTQPVVGSNVSVTVGTTAWMAVGQVVYIVGGGYYTVASVADLTHASLTNLGYVGNAASGITVSATGSPAVSPAGLIGQSGNAYTTTTVGFTMPASGSTVTVTVGSTAWLAQGQNVYIQGAGYFSVSVVVDATHVALINLGAPSNVSPGSVVALGAGVTAAGATGQTGPAGPVGASGSALINSALSVQGTGAVASPVELVNDNATPGNSMLYGTNPSGTKGWYSQPSGGATSLLPSAGIFDYDDFDGTPNNAVSIPGGKLGWVYFTGSGGGGWAPATLSAGVGVDATNKAFGVWRCSCSSTASSGGALYLPGSMTGDLSPIYTGLFPGLGTLTVEWRVALDQVNTAANDAQVQFGIGATLGGGLQSASDGIYFETGYGANGTGNWFLVVTKGGTPTKVNCGVPPSVPGYDKLQFVVSGVPWSSVSASINGTPITVTGMPITTNFPIVAISAGWAMMQKVTIASGNRYCYADYYWRNYQYTR